MKITTVQEKMRIEIAMTEAEVEMAILDYLRTKVPEPPLSKADLYFSYKTPTACPEVKVVRWFGSFAK